MIPFFRKLRKKFADDDKPIKYLRYAIGEIILVVIGILIALQINNWNETRKVDALTKTYLTNIKKDLVSDTVTFQAGISRIENTLKKQANLFNLDFISKISNDSLIPSIDGAFHSSRIYKINNSTFLKLRNSGFVESKPFNRIIIDINGYYTKEFDTWSEYLKWESETGLDLFSSESLGMWYDKIDLLDVIHNRKAEFNTILKKEHQLAFREYLKSPRFRNYAMNSNKKLKVILERMKHQHLVASQLIRRINLESNIN
jgi:hypothetical protein